VKYESVRAVGCRVGETVWTDDDDNGPEKGFPMFGIYSKRTLYRGWSNRVLSPSYVTAGSPQSVDAIVK